MSKPKEDSQWTPVGHVAAHVWVDDNTSRSEDVCVVGMCVRDATCPRLLHCERHPCECPEEDSHEAL